METVRVVAWEVRPIIMADDGTNLRPIEVTALSVPAAAWTEWKAGDGDITALDAIEAQLNPTAEPERPAPTRRPRK